MFESDCEGADVGEVVPEPTSVDVVLGLVVDMDDDEQRVRLGDEAVTSNSAVLHNKI